MVFEPRLRSSPGDNGDNDDEKANLSSNISRHELNRVLERHASSFGSNRVIVFIPPFPRGQAPLQKQAMALSTPLSRLHHIYYSENCPCNQECRFTGYELIHDHIPLRHTRSPRSDRGGGGGGGGGREGRWRGGGGDRLDGKVGMDVLGGV